MNYTIGQGASQSAFMKRQSNTNQYYSLFASEPCLTGMVIPMLMIRRSYHLFINMGTPIPGMVLQYGDSHANDKTVL